MIAEIGNLDPGSKRKRIVCGGHTFLGKNFTVGRFLTFKFICIKTGRSILNFTRNCISCTRSSTCADFSRLRSTGEMKGRKMSLKRRMPS